jgi:agmatinase
MPAPVTPGFLEEEIGRPAARGSRIHVIPAPFEASVSYGGGTARGPAAILAASNQLELWDGQGVPADAGIHTRPAVDCSGPAEAVLTRIEAAVTETLEAGAVPVLLGGEHTVTLGALAALHRALGPAEPFGVVQFDAHADLRDAYQGSRLSHACVMRRALDLGLPLFQIGVRALCRDEHDLREALAVGRIDGPDLPLAPPRASVLPPDFPARIYVTFDVDGLDPALMPSTGTPVPGGLFWHQAMWLLDDIARGRTLVGCDVTELAPAPGQHGPDFTAARLAYALMGLIARG